jgi:hypothetical protein
MGLNSLVRLWCRPRRDSFQRFAASPDSRPGLMNGVASRLAYGQRLLAISLIFNSLQPRYS